jgi:hypothetical protein
MFTSTVPLIDPELFRLATRANIGSILLLVLQGMGWREKRNSSRGDRQS